MERGSFTGAFPSYAPAATANSYANWTWSLPAGMQGQFNNNQATYLVQTLTTNGAYRHPEHPDLPAARGQYLELQLRQSEPGLEHHGPGQRRFLQQPGHDIGNGDG